MVKDEGVRIGKCPAGKVSRQLASSFAITCTAFEVKAQLVRLGVILQKRRRSERSDAGTKRHDRQLLLSIEYSTANLVYLQIVQSIILEDE